MNVVEVFKSLHNHKSFCMHEKSININLVFPRNQMNELDSKCEETFSANQICVRTYFLRTTQAEAGKCSATFNYEGKSRILESSSFTTRGKLFNVIELERKVLNQANQGFAVDVPKPFSKTQSPLTFVFTHSEHFLLPAYI